MESLLIKVYEYLLVYGLNVIAAIVIFLIGRWLSGVISRLIEKMMLKANAEIMLAQFVKNIAYSGKILCLPSRFRNWPIAASISFAGPG